MEQDDLERYLENSSTEEWTTKCENNLGWKHLFIELYLGMIIIFFYIALLSFLRSDFLITNSSSPPLSLF